MCPTWARALRGLRSGGGGSCGIGEHRQLLGRWGRARSTRRSERQVPSDKIGICDREARDDNFGGAWWGTAKAVPRQAGRALMVLEFKVKADSSAKAAFGMTH